MTEYLVFPIPIGFEKVKASSVRAAVNKYRKTMPDMSEEELIVVPSSFAQKTSIDIIVPLWKCELWGGEHKNEVRVGWAKGCLGSHGKGD